MGYDVLFFAINGSGMGHLSRCLAYARHLPDGISACFFTLAAAVEQIEEMGFIADYFVSPFWSANRSPAWNSELAVRFGMFLERTSPKAIVFDGTWPFQGFWGACLNCRSKPKLVWSRRGLLKNTVKATHVEDKLFDLVIEPGELHADAIRKDGGNRIVTSPVTILDAHELADKNSARKSLGMNPESKYLLLNPGPGNLKDVREISEGLIARFRSLGWQVVWTYAPITTHDPQLPDDVITFSAFPLARYLRAFDAMIGAAGYNTCCEIVQSQIPALLVPNEKVADDQEKRAGFVCEHARACVNSCSTPADMEKGIADLLNLISMPPKMPPQLSGALEAAHAIADLVDSRL